MNELRECVSVSHDTLSNSRCRYTYMIYNQAISSANRQLCYLLQIKTFKQGYTAGLCK